MAGPADFNFSSTTAFGNLPRVGAPVCVMPGSTGLASAAAAGGGLSGSGEGVSSGGKGAGSLGASTTLGGGASAGASLNNWQPLSEAASKHERSKSAVRLDTDPA